MRELEIAQFESETEFVNYLDAFSGDIFHPYFFCDAHEAQFFFEQLKEKKLRIFESDYLKPFKDIRTNEKGDLVLSAERKKVLDQYQTKGCNVDIVRESILMFLNPLFTDLKVQERNILVDSNSKSVILTGSFTFQRLEDFILSELGQITENIYVFPNQESDQISSPFGFEKFIKIVANQECKCDFEKRRSKLIRESMSNIVF